MVNVFLLESPYVATTVLACIKVFSVDPIAESMLQREYVDKRSYVSVFCFIYI